MAKYEPKTKATGASVKDFLNAVENETRRADGLTLLKMMEHITGEKAKLIAKSYNYMKNHYKHC